MNTLLLRRFAMMGLVSRETKGINEFHCVGYDHNDYQWDSASNLARLDDAPVTKTSHAQINKTGAGTEAWIYTLFNASSLPSDAIVVYADIETKAYSGATGSRTVQPYCNGVAKLEPISLGTNASTTQHFIVSKLTIEEITCKFHIKNGDSQTGNQYIRLYGATLRVSWDMNPEYFHFQDPEVESVIADKIGNGVGITLDAMQIVNIIPASCFKDNTDIVNFDELKYFDSLKSISGSCFSGCENLEVITIPPTVTNIGDAAFYNCMSLKNLEIPCNITSGVFRISSTVGGSVGDGTGNLIIRGNKTNSSYYSTSMRFKNLIIYGNFISDTGGGWITPEGSVIRIKGYCESIRGGSGTAGGVFSNVNHGFVEVGDFTTYKNGTSYRFFSGGTRPVFVNKDSVMSGTPTTATISYISTLYVGQGISRAADEAVLALYLADTNWSAYSAKLATWYDYNGTYKWYYVTDNLTNCTNTNPDAWPHITRKDEYRTTIVADDGYTLQSVQVQMYQCADDTATPNTPTDITSQVYNASTGEIYIEHVVGNVIITATAS